MIQTLFGSVQPEPNLLDRLKAGIQKTRSGLVDRLEDAGFASRVQDAANRRRVLVQPSKEAGGRAFAVFGPLIRDTATFLERYSEQELILIRDFLRGAQAVITEHTETLRDAQLGRGPGPYPPSESGGS